MALGILSIVGGLIGLFGAFASSNALIGAGIILFALGFSASSLATLSIPTPVLIILTLLGIFAALGGNK